MEKSTQTAWTLLVVTLVLIFAAIFILNYFLWILMGFVGFGFGYYFGYQRGKLKR